MTDLAEKKHVVALFLANGFRQPWLIAELAGYTEDEVKELVLLPEVEDMAVALWRKGRHDAEREIFEDDRIHEPGD